MLRLHHPYRRHPRPHTHRHYWYPGKTYYALNTGHSALIHHRLAMLYPPHPHLRHRHSPPHTRRHQWFRC